MTRSSSARGRGGLGEKSRGRGSKPRTGAASRAASAQKKPPVQKQNSADVANNDYEEWETASESSDVLDRRDSKSDINKDAGKDKKDVKKSFSSQRPGQERQNRRTEGRKSNSLERPRNSAKERSPNSMRPSGTQGNSNRNGSNNRNKLNSHRKENVSTVYRVDQVVPQDPNAIQNAINTTLDRLISTSSMFCSLKFTY